MIRFDQDLLSPWSLCRPPRPDFRRLQQAVVREGLPDRVPLFEVNIDNEVLSALLGTAVQNPGYVSRTATKSGAVSREDSDRYVRQLTRAYYHLGYDYVILPAYLPMGTHMLVGSDTAALLREGGRTWVDETKGPITTWDEFERYDWCQVADADTYMIEAAASILPEGMGIVVRTRGVMEWLMRLMGFEALCYSLIDDPELVGAVSERIGRLVVGLVRHLAQMDGVGAVSIYDDMGFRTGTFLSPAHLRRYVLPWTKLCVEAVHAQAMPFILHSCGNLEKIMDDLIDEVGIDAKHSFEDTIMPMAQVKARYGGRVGLLGGVDMHLLASATPEEVRKTARQAVQDCAPGGGYVFGSGNTIANYVPLENYLAMIDEVRCP
jgi:uroporphyrinogen decarboxylase